MLDYGPIVGHDEELGLLVTVNGAYLNLWIERGDTFENTDCRHVRGRRAGRGVDRGCPGGGGIVMALEPDPPYLGEIGDETETWEERERQREEKLERAFQAQRERRPSERA